MANPLLFLFSLNGGGFSVRVRVVVIMRAVNILQYGKLALDRRARKCDARLRRKSHTVLSILAKNILKTSQEGTNYTGLKTIILSGNDQIIQTPDHRKLTVGRDVLIQNL